MPAPKGTIPPNAGRGRPKGVPNKATAAAREAIALFLDNNVHRLQDWLDAIAKDNPAKAFSLFQSLLEYHVPKLSNVEARDKGNLIIVHKDYIFPDDDKPALPAPEPQPLDAGGVTATDGLLKVSIKEY